MGLFSVREANSSALRLQTLSAPWITVRSLRGGRAPSLLSRYVEWRNLFPIMLPESAGEAMRGFLCQRATFWAQLKSPQDGRKGSGTSGRAHVHGRFGGDSTRFTSDRVAAGVCGGQRKLCWKMDDIRRLSGCHDQERKSYDRRVCWRDGESPISHRRLSRDGQQVRLHHHPRHGLSFAQCRHDLGEYDHREIRRLKRDGRDVHGCSIDT